MADQNGTFALFEKIKHLIDVEIDNRMRPFCRTRKMTVTTAYNADTQLVGVSEAVGKEIKLPVFGSVDVSKLTVGTAVWVFAPYSSMSNAMVFMLGNGETGYAASAGNSDELGGNPPSFYIPPVGIILPFWDDTEPAAIWGGTWELIGSGRTLIQSGSGYALGAAGGEASHTLSVDEMPSHTHWLAQAIINTDGELQPNGQSQGNFTVKKGDAGCRWFSAESQFLGQKAWGTSTQPAGGSQPHNNMPPYLAVNFWKRTA